MNMERLSNLTAGIGLFAVDGVIGWTIFSWLPSVSYKIPEDWVAFVVAASFISILWMAGIGLLGFAFISFALDSTPSSPQQQEEEQEEEQVTVTRTSRRYQRELDL